MKKGIINCSCGQQFYYETRNTIIECIQCKKLHETGETIEEGTIEEGTIEEETIEEGEDDEA